MSMQRVMGGRGLERGPRGSKRAHSRGTIGSQGGRSQQGVQVSQGGRSEQGVQTVCEQGVQCFVKCPRSQGAEHCPRGLFDNDGKLAGQHQDGVTMGLVRVPQCQCTPWSEHGAWARRSRTGAAPEAGVYGGGKRR